MDDSLPAAVRARVLRMLEEAHAAATPRSELTALVLDSTTLRVTSRGVTVSELMDEHHRVTLVDMIDSPHEQRAPEELRSRMDAIYFLAPTTSSVEALVRDYESSQPMYSGSAHVFFTRHLPEALLDLLRHSGAVKYIRTFREVNLDFVALHPHAFSFDAPSALGELYGPSGASARAAHIERYAEQLCTVCSSLGEVRPNVRYHAAAHPVTKQFANRLAGMLSSQGSQESTEMLQRRRPRATVLIIDRASDPLTPLLHDFSLEGLAQVRPLLDMTLPLLKLCRESNSTPPTRQGASLLREGRYCRGSEAGGDVLLQDSSPVWRDLRYRSYELVPATLQVRTSSVGSHILVSP